MLWGLASAATALTTTLIFLIVVRILLGAGQSIVTPASLSYIHAHFDEKQRGRTVGVYMIATNLVSSLGIPLAGYLVNLWGWRTTFLAMGLGGLVWLIPWMAWVSKDEISASARTVSETQTPEGPPRSRLSVGQLLRSPMIWGIIVGGYCYMSFSYSIISWLPLYLGKQYGLSLTGMRSWQSGASFVVMIYVGGWLGDLFITRGYDPINVRKGFTVLGFCTLGSWAIGILADNVTVIPFLMVVSSCGLGLATANHWALILASIPRASIATVVGIQNTAFNLAGIVTPSLFGWMVAQTGDFGLPTKSIGLYLVIGTLCYSLLVRRKYAPGPNGFY